jgi:hypothetical protein
VGQDEKVKALFAAAEKVGAIRENCFNDGTEKPQ